MEVEDEMRPCQGKYPDPDDGWKYLQHRFVEFPGGARMKPEDTGPIRIPMKPSESGP
jgi:hypothetical protein